MAQNKALIFKKVPTDLPKFGEHFAIEERVLDLDADLKAGSILVQIRNISIDPYLRGRMRGPDVKSYVPGYELNEPMSAFAIVTVLKSANSKFVSGQSVLCGCDIANYAVVPEHVLSSARVIDGVEGLDTAHHLGALGLSGLTAYSSFYEIGKPKKGEIIFVSAASGAVGQIVVQLAKHEGLTVIGSVGDDAKLGFLTGDFKCDQAFNYKKEKTADALRRLAPDGIDIYYDNVGGETLDAALGAMKVRGRIVVCGAISQTNLAPQDRYGLKNFSPIVHQKRITIRGFIFSDEDMGPKYAKEHGEKMTQWLVDGTFKAKLDVFEGIDRAGEAFLSLFSGKNHGKVVLKVS